jgi:hydrogenase expression/formation protein HypD
LFAFGDMIRVPGSTKSLLQAKADGGDLRILYSPLEAVNIAAANPDKEVVFFAVGFETTAPSNALSVVHAHKLGLNNYSILVSHVLVPPAMEAILSDKFCTIDAFLAAGHVCTIMGLDEYHPIAKK